MDLPSYFLKDHKFQTAHHIFKFLFCHLKFLWGKSTCFRKYRWAGPPISVWCSSSRSCMMGIFSFNLITNVGNAYKLQKYKILFNTQYCHLHLRMFDYQYEPAIKTIFFKEIWKWTFQQSAMMKENLNLRRIPFFQKYFWIACDLADPAKVEKENFNLSITIKKCFIKVAPKCRCFIDSMKKIINIM